MIKLKAPQSAPLHKTLGFKRIMSKPIIKEKRKGKMRVKVPPIILPGLFLTWKFYWKALILKSHPPSLHKSNRKRKAKQSSLKG
ncbi:hypothetical protein ES703_111102 [subsurface metagenome]